MLSLTKESTADNAFCIPLKAPSAVSEAASSTKPLYLVRPLAIPSSDHLPTSMNSLEGELIPSKFLAASSALLATFLAASFTFDSPLVIPFLRPVMISPPTVTASFIHAFNSSIIALTKPFIACLT